MMNALILHYRSGLRALAVLIAVLVFQFVAVNSYAAFPVHVKHTNSAHTIRSHPIVNVRYPLRFSKEAVPAGDSYKGIIALVAGGAGMASLLVALITASIGGVFAAFFLGLAGIAFGVLPKKTNRGLGRAGLILGIVDVVLVLLFIAAVFIALASFT